MGGIVSHTRTDTAPPLHSLACHVVLCSICTCHCQRRNLDLGINPFYEPLLVNYVHVRQQYTQCKEASWCQTTIPKWLIMHVLVAEPAGHASSIGPVVPRRLLQRRLQRWPHLTTVIVSLCSSSEPFEVINVQSWRLQEEAIHHVTSGVIYRDQPVAAALWPCQR